MDPFCLSKLCLKHCMQVYCLTVFPLFLLSPQYIRLRFSKPEAEPVTGFSLLPRQRSKTVLRLVLSLDPMCFWATEDEV